MENSTPLVDAETVAADVGQAKSSVYRLAKLGLIPSYKAGPRLRGVRFDLAEVRAALRRPPAIQKEEVRG
jgi:hypothetical protein